MSVPSTTYLTVAFWVSFSYLISVFSVGVLGVGGTYPLDGSCGSTGFSGFPSGSFGVVPGICGITGTLGLFGSFGSVGLFGSTTLPGSVGSFGYGIGLIGVSPSGTFGVHVPTGTYLTFRSWLGESTVKSVVDALTLDPSASTKSPCVSWLGFTTYPLTTGDVFSVNLAVPAAFHPLVVSVAATSAIPSPVVSYPTTEPSFGFTTTVRVKLTLSVHFGASVGDTSSVVPSLM